MSCVHELFDTARLNAISITEVARRLGEVRRAGSVYKTYCPWHEDRHPSLTLYERTNENRCHCFACGRGGSVIDFVMQHESWTFQEACRWLSNEFGISTLRADSQQAWHRPPSSPQPRPRAAVKPAEPTYTYIPKEMVESLKVQHYETDRFSPRFAHSDPGSCRWLGSIWSAEGRLPKDAQFRSSCLFGEHLTASRRTQTVALVESPKNAIFGALEFPQYLWVATGNKGQLKREVLQPLKGRDIIVIPDRDAIEEWTETVRTMADLANFTVSDICRRVAPAWEEKYDIADYLVRQHQPMPF